MSEEDKAKEGKYTQFYAEFGAVLKEGLGEDFANRERIAKLLRFATTSADTPSVGLRRLQGAHEGRPGGHLLHHRRHPGGRQTARSSKSSEEGHRVLS